MFFFSLQRVFTHYAEIPFKYLPPFIMAESFVLIVYFLLGFVSFCSMLCILFGSWEVVHQLSPVVACFKKCCFCEKYSAWWEGMCDVIWAIWIQIAFMSLYKVSLYVKLCVFFSNTRSTEKTDTFQN